ncbi:triple tyrosine motif-containing protein [Ichthyenterobacterium sp. W332]|uniref:Triple tyrosine motif-containing protein n=1 Tax=Microcosmobacter mediterraneus TaxID=3075607 RepID=A0ABU2YL75_9FLAO|nr:triple tyrosine motif-containing protein [Ichthyenterobacterium sp. W332]MDT0558449.1 triple tyrosine motif-containing protein [Ichthyenterobacterium sp. W332]
MKHFKYCFLIAFVIICIPKLVSQELPPIQNFLPEHYHGETQNWSITQDNSKTIYIANNKGLLSFNGEQWRLYPSPNESIIRSVKVIDEKVYSGLYMDFGYWQKDEMGLLQYNSLSKNLKVDLIEDEQFWQISALQDWILFQSLNRIYIYNTIDESFSIIESNTGITKMFKVEDHIYFQKNNQGLFKIESGKAILVSDDPLLMSNRIINVFDRDEKLLVQTQDKGFYTLGNSSIRPWNNQLNELLKTISTYSSIQLKNGHIALGTISNGLLILNNQGELLDEINQNKGLSNNTVLALHEDLEHNLWLGTDNGLSCINMNPLIKIYDDFNGQLGSVYTSALHQGYLFLGTNQGLFYKTYNSIEDFKFIEGTQGQVWNLTILNNNLFCGHNAGTFIIDKATATKIADIEGTWNIMPIPNKPNLLIQGNYDGLYILEKKNTSWSIKNKIDGFNISTKYFEFINNEEIIISHEYKGIIKLELDSDFKKVNSIDINDTLRGLKSSLVKYHDEIYYAYNNGIYKYNLEENDFIKDNYLSKIFTKESFVSGELISDQKNNRLWLFTNNEITSIEPGNFSSTPKVESIPLPYELIKSVPGYENVLSLNADKYLLGTTNGYIVLDLNKIPNKNYTSSITSVFNAKRKNEISKNRVSLNSEGEFTNEEHDLEITYTIHEFDKYFKAEYQYQLLGIYDTWSNWSTDSKQTFENLPHGNYTFNVKGRINNKETENIASYTFSIAKPWYISNTMLVLYIIGFILLSLILHNVYKHYYRKQQNKLVEENRLELELKELENQKQIMRIQNASLEQDIENKNRELAISTMSLIKKNEFLSTIKNELKKSPNEELKKVIRIIDKNINNTDDWKLFEEAFNNADKDFLKKVKAKHTTLTPNDLRLCAYLRLNLSSKEIAPLLNISPRSVEVKRYRLRKKIGLAHEESLTNYIIDL